MPVKNGFLTSEFYITLIVQIVGVMAALGYLTPEVAETWQKAAVQIGGLIAQVVSAAYYAWGRQNIKAATAKECLEPGEPKKPKGVEVVSVSLIVLALAVSCTMHQGAVPFDKMTPMDKASFFTSLYNKQYDNYLEVATQPGTLSEDQKTILRKKKALLEKVYPMIEAYADYVAAGVAPGAEKEQAIIKLLDDLAAMTQ